MNRASRRVLVTGASGFIGSALMRTLHGGGYQVTGALRNQPDDSSKNENHLVVGDIDGDTDWSFALTEVDVVIHCAARVHIMNDTSADPLHDFRRVNVDATLRLARQAAEAGVSRFIFLSSIKVNGESTEGGTPFTSVSPECPVDPYGLSKYEAEQGLRALASEMGIDVVIIRPVLVYGPGVGANFQRMTVWLEKGIPLPLGALFNKRSMVALDNLIDLVVTCIDHPAAGNQTFLVSDDQDLSTTELLVAMGHALDKPARLLPVPVRLIWWGAALLGNQEVARRVCGSLQVDISHTRSTLGWTPPVSVAEGLRRTTKAGRSKA